MEINDLRLFSVAARHASLHQAAHELHITPSAISKAVRRLEEGLRTPLFDRVGKGLLLNTAGARLQARALEILQLVEQARSEFAGSSYAVDCRIAAPALLQARYAPYWGRALDEIGHPASLRLLEQFEAEAIQALARGEADFAVVSSAVCGPSDLPSGYEAIPIERLPMQVAVANDHPLAAAKRCKAAQVLSYEFVCPSRSLLCGLKRGVGSDGWRDDALPRRIRYRVDDLHALLTLVHNQQAIAYLPSFLIAQEGFATVRVTDCPFQCEEQAMLVWRPTQAMGWQSKWVAELLGL
jgi:DNA-binding transcriptional LysR family regulator